MDLIVMITILSLLLLLMSLLLIYSKFNRKTATKFLIIIAFYLCNAVPLVYVVYLEKSQPFFQDNLTIGTAFLMLWSVTAIVLLFGVAFRFRAKKEDQFY